MSLLALIAAHATDTEPPAPIYTPDPDVTYPASAPYNVDSWLSFTDPYGHGGSVVHLDVLDMGTTGWRSKRWWMVCTPYYNKAFRDENPSVYHGTNVATWTEAGTNPVVPPPANTAQWNSDPDLVHDPATDELVLIYRDGTFTPRLARSADGATWPTTTTAVDLPGVTEEKVSPTLLRVGAMWHMWAIAHPSRVMHHWTATAPGGPWSGRAACTGWNTDIWHFNIVHDGSRFYCLMHEGWTTGTGYAASSPDGITWTKNATPVLTLRPGAWDGTELYRSALVLHENGTHMRVWYSGYGTGSDSWRVAYTQIPLTEWP